ncbi:F-box domain [Arabidopsis thaliana x Arabidopsis arenosa]|uniref:F-box domain n=1 Tax=Arabidopsis thaliana x Arabidopsis arenosa TaxID=1240361 RepID=A0A8T1ZRM4_9BRAS|nr:F-box domain [Arabidopsis thaliana x Arabidopsis arenosa]
MEKSGDTIKLNTLAMSVHEVMLESGFVLFDAGSDKISFSKKLLSVSLRYTLPELITSKDTNTIEYVTVKFQSLGYMVVVYGSLNGSSPRRVLLDKRGFVPVIDTLMSDKEGSSSIYHKVFKYWRMVKYGLVIPLLIGLSNKAPCLMCLPTEIKMKIIELLPGASVAKMACLCTELRSLSLDDDLWKRKWLKEAKNVVVITRFGVPINWKENFAAFWRKHQRERLLFLHDYAIAYW